MWSSSPPPPAPAGHWWSESICFGKGSLSRTTSNGFPRVSMFGWSSSVWPNMLSTQHCIVEVTCFHIKVDKCSKFILISKSANCIARAGLLPFCKMPVPSPLLFWVISAICPAAWCSLSWAPQNVARRLIEVRVEKWVESQMALYLTCRTNKHRVGALPIMFHHSILSTLHMACHIPGI